MALTFFQCTNEPEQQELTDQEDEGKVEQVDGFNYDDYKISKGQLGNIRIGMTIEEAYEHTSQFQEITSEAFFYGYGGGSPAYEYYKDNELLFALIPKLNTDSILFIIGISPNLKTHNDLTPTTSTRILLNKYDKITLNQDLMSGGENFHDSINNWTYHFATEPDSPIGDYQQIDQPYSLSEISESDAKSVWIVIQ